MNEILVLEDAILAQDGELPDELDPVFLTELGLRMGGHAAEVAQLMRAELHAEEWYGRYDLEALYKELVLRRTNKRKPPFEGLLLEEVQTAVRWHVESQQQLDEIGMCSIDAPNWQWLRTLYRTRAGDVFQLSRDGASWIRKKTDTDKQLEKPIQSKVRRELVIAPEGRRMDPRLKAHGWYPSTDNLIRNQLWEAHSRERRAKATGTPPPKRVAHLWKATDAHPVEQCKRCQQYRFPDPYDPARNLYAGPGAGTPEEMAVWRRDGAEGAARMPWPCK